MRRGASRWAAAKPEREWGAPPASVAPAGGSNQGDGPHARPHPFQLSAGPSPPARSWSRGGGLGRAALTVSRVASSIGPDATTVWNSAAIIGAVQYGSI